MKSACTFYGCCISIRNEAGAIARWLRHRRALAPAIAASRWQWPQRPKCSTLPKCWSVTPNCFPLPTCLAHRGRRRRVACASSIQPKSDRLQPPYHGCGRDRLPSIGRMTSLSYTFSNLLGTVYRQGNLVFSSDGAMLYSAVGNRVSGFDLIRSKSFTFPFEARRNISRLALSPDGAILLAIDDEGHLLMANVFRRVVVHHLNLKGKVADLKFSPDGRWVAFAIGRLVQVWATPALERSFTPFALHQTFGGHGDDVLSLSWSADSLFIASGGKDMNVKVHSVYKLPGYTPPSLTGHRSSVRAVFFGNDGKTIYAITRVRTLSPLSDGKGARHLAAPGAAVLPSRPSRCFRFPLGSHVHRSDDVPIASRCFRTHLRTLHSLSGSSSPDRTPSPLRRTPSARRRWRRAAPVAARTTSASGGS